MSAKILILDIETAPETAYIWKRFKETVGQTQIKEPGYLLCMSWAWLGQPAQNIAIYKNRSWGRGVRNDDYNVVKKAHELLSEADIVVGHNIRSFDIGTLNARFVAHGFPPPTPYKVCDTIEIMKKKLHLPSNSLESASHYFGIPVKEKQSFALWRDCLAGIDTAWKKMTEYCSHDVDVTAELYKKLIPWADLHPNMGLYASEGSNLVCPKCGSDDLIRKGYQSTSVHTYQRYLCKECGGYSRSRIPVKQDRTHITTHAVIS